jgi:hypothetical protein
VPARALNRRPPLFLSLEPILRCPDRRCYKPAYHVSGDLLTLKCQHCGRVHWWATRLRAGVIRDQVRDDFDGDDRFVALLDYLEAPATIAEPMFWQIWLTGAEQHDMTNKRDQAGILERSLRFVRSISLPHRATRQYDSTG